MLGLINVGKRNRPWSSAQGLGVIGWDIMTATLSPTNSNRIKNLMVEQFRNIRSVAVFGFDQDTDA